MDLLYFKEKRVNLAIAVRASGGKGEEKGRDEW
jgi:hypothetical protein